MLKKYASKIAVVALIVTLAIVGVAYNSNSAHAADYVFTGNMTIGSTGANVLALQAYLNMTACCHVAESGPGSKGAETMYFGELTRAALAKFQASVGIAPAVGYFGPITMAYVNSHPMAGTPSNLPAGCTSTAGYSPTTGVKCDSTGGSSNDNGGDDNLSGGETSINNFDLSDPDDDTVNEGASKVEVAQIEFDVDDADAELDRVDLIFDGSTNTSGGEDQPWKVFDHVYLMNDGDVIADMASGDKEDWDETDDNDIYRIRLSGVSEVFNEGDNATLMVAVDVASNVDEAGTDADWEVLVATDVGEDDGLRFTDSEGIDTFVGEGTTGASFSIVEAGEDSEFTVQESDDSPDSDTLEVDETSTTELTLGLFTMDADEDGGDVLLTDFPVDVTIDDTGGETFDDVIDDVYVEIDGTKYRGEYSTGCGATLVDCTDGETGTFTFDDIEDDDIVINAGEDMDAEVSIKFKSQGTGGANYDNNTSVQVSTSLDSGDVEDADSGDDVGDVDGTADADTFYLVSSGISVDLVSTDTDTSGDNDTIGEYTFVVDVTAFGEDQWIELSGERDTTESNFGFNYLILDGSNNTVATGTSTEAFDVDDEDISGSNRVKVDENETVRFTVQFFFDAASNGSYKAQLYSVNFKTDPEGDPDQQHVNNPASDFRTNAEQVNAS